ncbi:MAG: ATP-binding cassette domain-containing protein [Phycisphaera sp.]|nr:ATP-binding cassette domain-containing protein [Phycisphaera sp.]
MLDVPPQHALKPRLEMHGVHKSFGATLALRGVDLSVQPGEVHGLIGENGAGKSTLMKVLSGAHAPDRGTLALDGQSYAPRSPLHARRQGVAMIYQELSLAPHLTVMENILLGIEPTTGPFMRWAECRRIARNALNQVGLDHVQPTAIVGHLSIAQQQLVEIARAVAMDCRVLVLDEPTSSLTRKDIANLFTLIRKLKATGHAVVYISHFLEEVREVCDNFTVMRDGQTVGGGKVGEVPNGRIIAMMVGREVTDLYPRSPRTPGEVVLEIDHLAGPVKPIDASLRLHRGEVLGIAGLVGAGRTELLRTVFGLDQARSGRVKVMANIGGAAPATRWRQGVGMVSEDRKTEGLALGMSIADNMTLSRLEGLGPMRTVMPSRQRRAAQPWIEKVPIKCASAGQAVGDLSGGNQQKVAIARLLHHDADVWLLDEPTRGIDVGSKAQIYRLIDELALGDPATGRKPRAVLMVSSYLPELLGVCDRIAVMSRGVLGQPRKVKEWNEHELMVEATGQQGR